MNEALRVSEQGVREVSDRRDSLANTAAKLRGDLNPAKTAVLEAEHMALEAEFNRTQMFLQKTKFAEAHAAADRNEAVAKVKAYKEAARSALEDAENARKEGQEELAA